MYFYGSQNIDSALFISGIIPGPHEPRIDINTFLKPLVDDLLDLWDGISLTPGGSVIMRAALLAVAADLPAMRKITQFLSHKANLGCTRCKFSAEREPDTVGASGRMCYFTSQSSVERSHSEVLSQAREYQQALTKGEAKRIAQRNGVRYSQLLRLPYFDIVRMTTVDPMHTFLLGMVKRETELNLSLMSSDNNCELIRRLKSIKLPYDIGRLPSNMFDNNSLDGATADQWKTYITVCARPCMRNLIPRRAYRCLVLLSEIVARLSSPVFCDDDITSLRRLLDEHHKLFHSVYGKWAVTVNYHVCLHIQDIILDYGPPNSFWCFSYERLNGILAGTPNSNRSVELDMAERFMSEFSFTSINLTQVNGLDIPNSLSSLTEETPNEDQYVRSFPLTKLVVSALSTRPEDRFEHQMMLDKGEVEGWPIEFHHPCQKNVKVNKYGRCTVNGQSFSSEFNSTDRGSIVKVMFVDTSNKLIPYFGVVKYYFTLTAVVDNKPKPHFLSHMLWFKLKSDDPDPLSKLYVATKSFDQTDKFISPRRFLCRCVFASTKCDGSARFICELLK